MPGPDELSLFIARLEATGAPYMVTGATAAILYGQPRVTNDLDVVLSLNDEGLTGFLRAFPETEFYVPPETVIRTERARNQRGHFNLIHHESGYKADIYLTGADPLHAWAMPLRRILRWNDAMKIVVAPSPNMSCCANSNSIGKADLPNIRRTSVRFEKLPALMKASLRRGWNAWIWSRSGKN
jgi:hypothetical protein